MNNNRTATIPMAVVPNAVDDRFAHCMTTAMRTATPGRDTPGAGCQPELAHYLCVRSAPRTVVVGELDVLVKHVPLSVPTPQFGAVNTAQ